MSVLAKCFVVTYESFLKKHKNHFSVLMANFIYGFFCESCDNVGCPVPENVTSEQCLNAHRNELTLKQTSCVPQPDYSLFCIILQYFLWRTYTGESVFNSLST